MRKSSRQKRAARSPLALKIKNMIRRLTPTVTAALAWTVKGYSDGTQTESIDSVPVFGGGGFASRPRVPAHGEAIVGRLGGESNSAVIIATRDEHALAQFESLVGKLADGETAIFNESGAGVKIDSLGNIVAVPAVGGFVKLGSATPDVLLPPLNGVLTGESIDPFTQKPHAVLGNASLFVLARKI